MSNITKVEQYIQNNEVGDYNQYYSIVIDIDYTSMKSLMFYINPYTKDQYYSIIYYKKNLQCVSNYIDFEIAQSKYKSLK